MGLCLTQGIFILLCHSEHAFDFGQSPEGLRVITGVAGAVAGLVCSVKNEPYA